MLGFLFFLVMILEIFFLFFNTDFWRIFMLMGFDYIDSVSPLGYLVGYVALRVLRLIY